MAGPALSAQWGQVDLRAEDLKFYLGESPTTLAAS